MLYPYYAVLGGTLASTIPIAYNSPAPLLTLPLATMYMMIRLTLVWPSHYPTLAAQALHLV